MRTKRCEPGYTRFTSCTRRLVVHCLVTGVLLLAVPCAGVAQSNHLHPKIDSRVELLNILYFMAGPRAHLRGINPHYFESVEQFFESRKGHPAVSYTRSLIEKAQQDSVDIKDWWLPSLAVHLTFDGTFRIVAPENTGHDAWDDRTLVRGEYVDLINDFYRESNAGSFFETQRGYFDAVERVFVASGVQIDAGWVDRFFTLKPTETYSPIQGLLPTGGAYLRVNLGDNRRHTYTLFSGDQYDEHGLPRCIDTTSYVRAMVHEYIHCYANQIIDNDTMQWMPVGAALLRMPSVHEKVRNTFYGNWRYLLYESLVRAVSIQYAIAKGEDRERIEADIARNEGLGFLWMRDLTMELSFYQGHRDRYPDFEHFKARLLEAFSGYVQ